MSENVCPVCGNTKGVYDRHKHTTFPYGSGKDAVELPIVVIEGSCHRCGFTWTDWRAEEVKSTAVYNHLCRVIKALETKVVALEKELAERK